MVDPRLALLAFFLIATITLAVVWPRRGIAARIHRLLQLSDRVRLEDALKYLFHRGTEGEVVHEEALAGSLEVSRAGARAILETLADRGLAEPSGTAFRLTGVGRAEALRIVRSHRLLERYLADRTGIGPEEWHELAEEREHLISPQEIESLAARLGQPRYDPHGDPIPTATGELPATEGVLLSALTPGDAGVVVHLEDEPADVFERLVALGFALGNTVVVRSRGPAGIELELDGTLVTLPHALEVAVSVVRSADRRTARPRTLADLTPGEVGRVRRLATTCRGAQRRRLLDLGVVPGTEIESELRSASGDPTAYRIRGALIALRRHQAAWIELESDSADREAAA